MTRSIDYPDGLFEDFRRTWFPRRLFHPRQIYKEQLLESPPGTRIVLINSSVNGLHHATFLRCEGERFHIIYDQFGTAVNYPDQPFCTDYGLAPDSRGFWNHVNWVEFEQPGYIPVIRSLPKRSFVLEKLDWRVYGF